MTKDLNTTTGPTAAAPGSPLDKDHPEARGIASGCVLTSQDLISRLRGFQADRTSHMLHRAAFQQAADAIERQERVCKAAWEWLYSRHPGDDKEKRRAFDAEVTLKRAVESHFGSVE